MGPRAWREDDAVSEVVGTILLVAISVMLFAGLSMVVWQQMQTSPLPANVDLRMDVDGEWVSVTHTWGESLPVAETRFLVTVGGTRSDYKLDEAPLAGNLDHDATGSPEHWDLGETLWLACPAGEACALPGDKLDSVTSVDTRANAVISSTLPGVTQGLILNPLPDLVVTTDPVIDMTPVDGMYEGCQYRFRAIVANTGLEPAPADATNPIVTKFYLDASGTAFDTHERTAPLAIGATYVVESDPVVVSGEVTHTVKVVVDEDNNIEEISGDPPDENAAQRSFSLSAGEADPGFAYEDVDDDGIYDPCGSMDVHNHDAIVDGDHATAAGVGIVIPPSVDPISAAAPITLTAGGSLTVGVDLSATGSVTLDADNAMYFIGSAPPTVTAAGVIDIDADLDISMAGVTLSAEGFAITIDSFAGSILADGLVVPDLATDATRIDVQAGGYITMNKAVVNVEKSILIDADGATVDEGESVYLQAARLVAVPGEDLILTGKSVIVFGDGDMWIEDLFVSTKQDWIRFDVEATTNTIYVQDAHLQTPDPVGPNGASLTPTCPITVGTWAYGGPLIC